MKRLLLLGTGGIAAHHVDRIRRDPGMRRSSPASISMPGKAEEIRRQERHRTRHFESLDEAVGWGEFDAAINCTPDGAHKATTLGLLAAGKHVFCEKPLAPSYPDALAMTEAAESAGLINMVNLTYRNSPALQQARKMVEAGEIGDAAPCRGGLPAELAGVEGLGRRDDRAAMAVAAVDARTARPACWATSASTSSTSQVMARPTTSRASRPIW